MVVEQYGIFSCCIFNIVCFLFGKLSVGTLHNFLSESHFKSGDIVICSHGRGNLQISSQIAPVVALKSNLIHVNEVFFRHCPAVFIPGVTLVVHFCYFVVENLTGLFYLSLKIARISYRGTRTVVVGRSRTKVDHVQSTSPGSH